MARTLLAIVLLIERRPGAAALAAIGTLVLGFALWPSDAPLAIATFNIENFPRSEQQIERVFEIVAEMDVALLAVQEIRDPERFAREARSRLGGDWRFEHAHGPHAQKLGVLYDAERLSLSWTRTHHGTLIGRRAKPVFEARFEGGLRVLVVHLTSGARHAEARRRQLAAIEPAVRDAVATGDRVVMLGDFNASEPEDRANVAALAERNGLAWASERLACTSYWNRRDGCFATPLDHVLVSAPVGAIEARGACATDGCERRDRCPEYFANVSDHCPVRIELP